MVSSRRSAQLGLWREIVSKRHEETQPVNRHLDFIRRRFKELELQGFTWSRDSILGVFLQLGLPERNHGSFSSVNSILKSRHPFAPVFSSNEVIKAIQTEELRHKSRPRGLMDLPIEVFEKILETLDYTAKLEAEGIYDQKVHVANRRVMICRGHREPYITYLNHHSPVLNSIQSFSLTCREFYKLCQPWLWRVSHLQINSLLKACFLITTIPHLHFQKLQFPTSLPAPIDLWTKDILLRQGSHVQSISLILSPSYSETPYAVINTFSESLSVDLEYLHSSKSISPENVKDLINCCPNLSALKIVFPLNQFFEAKDTTVAFISEISPVFSSLKALRDLTFEDRNENLVTNEFPSQLISCLPLLESLTWHGLTPWTID
ncbi:uncharacterized protein MELLADRAFT_67049 [Melampsora larici-populina 98AG31]|uniref:F-box domain-containing protein n=1 Tax=Melampsora larici-populina (strain 98AG31 / pathotype 3-4-7) TaxID=747676 RepID=F4S1L2_MELLP|nr:uncharacterized protein MELLADRAFT_67049 [Melampsora larici-populina 98AG31]EGG01487.1 hypothetical protein MELLADRAFT_67049 [Melampsora larici-populina 98AG31]